MENTKRMLISGLVFLMMVSVASATVTRTIDSVNQKITYSSSLTTTYTKAYWAIEDTFSGCSLGSITCPSSSSITCAKTGNILRITGYIQNGVLPSAQVTITGSGTCSITGQWVESTAITPSPTPSSLPTGSITLVAVCNTLADTNCNGCVDDSEFPVAVNTWKQQTGGITDTIFPSVVLNWKNRAGC
jgi:hypothetical protein